MAKIIEVGPRDGLQNESKIVPFDLKIEFINKLVEAGCKSIEIASFVRADAIAQMADSDKLTEKVLKAYPNLSLPVLVPNKKGYERAIAVGVKEIAFFTATSETFNKTNINATIAESFERLNEFYTDKKIKLRGYVSTAFGCPYEKVTSVEKLVEVVQKLFQAGAYEVSIGDTIGVATPKQVKDIISILKKNFDLAKIAMHFHDTRGMALANVLVSLNEGINVFDSSAGGLGGCPYAKGATGNVATEDLLYLLHGQGVKTGIDLDKIIQASDIILKYLEKSSPSKFRKAYLINGY
jgi:hydroxymethylglutaryl-CoA lyase